MGCRLHHARAAAGCVHDHTYIRSKQLQYTRQRHGGLDDLLDKVLAHKENDAIPYAAQLLITVMVSDGQVLSASLAPSLAEEVDKFSTVPSNAGTTGSTTPSSPDPSTTSGKVAIK
ncbi:hypothetical protein EON65_33055 [archaeon]|nr:MAG: hypothetical protein EON65_33055 [archaeon]